MANDDHRDEYDCPAPHVPGPVARRMSGVLGGAWANVWLALLVGTARLAAAVAGRRDAAREAAPSRVAMRDGRRSADLGDDLAVPRARRAYS